MKTNLLLIFTFIFIVSCQESVKETDVSDQEMNFKPSDTILMSREMKEINSPSSKEMSERLKAKGFQIFEYVDEATKDTILMQQYYMAFLKRGVVRNQNEEEASSLQEAHLAHLSKMYELGYADISGPFGDDGDIRGITIYNVPTLEMADSLANADPMVKAGRLEIEIHPWWAAKGYPLR